MVQYEELFGHSKIRGLESQQAATIPAVIRRRGDDDGCSGRGSSRRLCTSSNPSRMLLRRTTPPRPSVVLSAAPAPAPATSWNKGLSVDVLWRDAWWEGILLEDLSLEKTSRLGIYFPDEEDGEKVCTINDLHLRQEWDEETARWRLKAHGKLALLKPSHSPVRRSLRNFCKQEPVLLAAKKLIFKRMVKKPKPVKMEQESDNEESSCSGGLDISRSSVRKKHSSIPSIRALMAPAAQQLLPTWPSSNLSRKRKPTTTRGSRGGDKTVSEVQEEQQHKRLKAQEQQKSGGRQKSLRSWKKKEVEQGSDPPHAELPISQGALLLQNSCRRLVVNSGSHVLGEDGEQAREKLVDILIVEQYSQTEKSRMQSSVQAFSDMRNSSIDVGISIVLRRRWCPSTEGEFDMVELSEKAKMDSNLHRAMQHRKPLSSDSQHCNLDNELHSKKRSRFGPTMDVTGLPELAQDAVVRALKSVDVYRGLGCGQERVGKRKGGGQGGCQMEVKLSAPEDPAPGGEAGMLMTSVNAKKSILSWLMDVGMLVENQKLRYMHRRKELGLDGWVTSEGVLCGCCKTIVTLSMFEAHCGSKLHRPCANIYVEDGRTLTELQMEALRKHNSSERSNYFHPAMGPGRRRSGSTKGKEHAADGNDDTCGVCGDGGMLICCDHCPSTFHLTCMELEAVPEEDWFCPNCRCAICGGPPVNANPDEFNEMVVLSCDQCEREFHLKCLYARGLPKLDQCPTGSWFCGHSCEKIFRDLRRLVGTSNPLEDGYSWTLLRSQEDLELSAMDKEVIAEQKIKLAIAFSVMQECFKPMIDPHTKVDIVAHVLYNRGSEVSRLNYCGFYTLILEKGDELISVATVRVHGAHLAEMPLIGTRFQYRRQGMCRRLMNALEQMLQMMGVQTLVLPAVPEMKEYWSGAFGFQPMEDALKRMLIELNLLVFPGTSILQKPLARLLMPAALPSMNLPQVLGLYFLASSSADLEGDARIRQSTIRRVAGELQIVSSNVPKEHEKRNSGLDSGESLDPLTACQIVEALVPVTTVENMVSLPVMDKSISPSYNLSESSLVHAREDLDLLSTDMHATLEQSPADVPRAQVIQHLQNGSQGDRYLEDGCMLKACEEELCMVEPVVETTFPKCLVNTFSPVGEEGCLMANMSPDRLPIGEGGALVDVQGNVPGGEELGLTFAKLTATSPEEESSLPTNTNSFVPLLKIPQLGHHVNNTGYHFMHKNGGRLGFEVPASGDTTGQPESGGTTKGQGSASLVQELLNLCDNAREESHPTPDMQQPESGGTTKSHTGNCPIQETVCASQVSLASCSEGGMEVTPLTSCMDQLSTMGDSLQESMSPSCPKYAMEGAPLAASTGEPEMTRQPSDTSLQGLQSLISNAKDIPSTPSMGPPETCSAMIGRANEYPEIGSVSPSKVSFSESAPSTPSMWQAESENAMAMQGGDSPMQESTNYSMVPASFFQDTLEGACSLHSSMWYIDMESVTSR
ncbi:unnamed protein product [Sphagnum compactum]